MRKTSTTDIVQLVLRIYPYRTKSLQTDHNIYMIKQLRLICRYSITKATKFINYNPGPPESMFIDQRNIEILPGEVLFKVKALGINRAECLHRQGKYKINRPIEGYLGLQASGEIYDPQCKQKLSEGIALITGGSYAEWVSLPASHVLPKPSTLSFLQAGAIPQAWITAFQLLRLAAVKEGDHVVVYAGASGVGTAAIQLGKLLGAHIWCVVSTPEKGKICEELGASGVVYYKDNPSWSKELQVKRGGLFNAVLDCVGPSNAEQTLDLLSIDGKWILFGLLSGAKANLNLATLIGKRISLISTTLKTRTDEYKASLIQDFRQTALSGFDKGVLRPIIYKTFPCDWSSVDPFVEAHKLMESNTNVGKIMIEFK